jgi:predicted transcriptional regulator
LHIEKKEELKKISRVFATKAAEVNMKILEVLAFKGPLNPYSIAKNLQGEEDQSTINRRTRKLAESKYVSVVEERPSQKSGQATRLYGLTLKGFLIALLFVEYDDKVDVMLQANKKNISFCDFFNEVITRKTLTSQEVKEIFLDRLKEFMSKGDFNVDTIPDYFLFKHAGIYILHYEQARLDNLPEIKAKTIANILFEFRRLSHPETTEKFLKPYLTNQPDK